MKSIFLFIPLVFVLFFISFYSHGQNKENQTHLDSIKTTLDNLNWQEIDSLGRQAQENLNYKEAEIYFKKNIEIAQIDSILATSLQRLGGLYYLERRFNEALTIFSETKEIEEKLGKQRIEYALACGNIALIKVAKGNYDEAEKLQLEAKEIREKIAGKISLDYAKSCTDLAIIYYYKGQYNKAEPLYIQAKDIRKEIFGEKHTEYAIACGNLATIYIRQGLYNKAEPLSLIAKNIYEEAVGKKHPNYTAFSGNLAILYYYQGKYNEAEPLFLEAKQLKEELTGTENQDYIRSCNNLAVLYEKQKDYQKAEELLIEVREKYKKLFGKNHFTYALACNSLGNIYKKKEEYKKSEPFYKEAKQIRKKILGKNHDDYVLSTFDLANLYTTQKLFQKAKPLYNESLQQKIERINIVFPTLSEKEKQSYFFNIEPFFNGFTDFAVEFYPQNKKISEDLFNQQLFTKGLIFSSTQKMKSQILNSGDSILINQYEEWKMKKKNYIALQQKPIEQRDSTINLIKVASQINELEREISKKSRTFESNSNQKKYAWQDVQSSISENEVVVEIIRLAKKNIHKEEQDTIYIALILTKETIESPELLVLENGKELENGALSFYQNNIEFQLEDDESYNQYWKPIQEKLDSLSKKGYSKIYFSPDGVYHKLNLNTLQNPKTNNYLVEEQNIQLITSSRDLIERKEKGIENVDLSKNFKSYEAYLLGYPSYNLNGKDTLKVNGTDRSLNGLQRIIGQQTVIPVLEGTKVETNQINDLLNKKSISTILLQNNEATEENIKTLKNPTILHIATHGFFINEIPESKVTTMQEAEDRNLLKNPFLRSGLLLAGCQNPQTGEEDGILSAEEAMNLNLDGTELVVLSACETGLGDVHNGEGVYGLQRAFRQAGAKTIIMSLWKVSDEATQLLMTTFYESLLSGKSKREAFKIAQLKLKKKYNEPYYWGAFVMVGE